METIFHEKQEGSLCAQHCLNGLLQGEYFTAVDLATLAQQIDEQERQTMAEGGVHSEDYRRFLHQPSGNLDDSGYFSVQVIASALKVWGLDLVPYSSSDPVAQAAQRDPTKQTAYICNYKEHWFTIRKLAGRWVNLNSLLPGPEVVSSTYLHLFLVQLQQEGYSIFVVVGKLPECEADLALDPGADEEELQVQEALRQSLRTASDSFGEVDYPERALSSEDAKLSFATAESALQTTTTDLSQTQSGPEMSEEEMLQAALRMSLES